MTDNEILDLAKQEGIPIHRDYDDSGLTEQELIRFARLIEQATRGADIAVAHDFIQYHMDFDKADECAKEMRNQK